MLKMLAKVSSQRDFDDRREESLWSVIAKRDQAALPRERLTTGRTAMLRNSLVRGVAISVALAISADGYACPAFSLKGNTNQPWNKLTLNEWNKKILPKGWKDKGGHFLSQIKSRGPTVGIDTPSDLESEVRKSTVQPDPPPSNRYDYVTTIVSSSGQHFRLIFDDNVKTCELVTATF